MKILFNILAFIGGFVVISVLVMLVILLFDIFFNNSEDED